MSTHRGRRPSTKPGASHLAALQKAHGAGDVHGAKLAALNYAKECTKHGTAKEEEAFHGSGMGMTQPGPPMSAKGPSSPKPSQPPPDRKAQLAKLAMSRKRA